MSRARSANGRLARAYHQPVDPVRIKELRRELAEAKITDYVEKVLADAPPLREEQRTRLAELLKPVRVNGGGVDETD